MSYYNKRYNLVTVDTGSITITFSMRTIEKSRWDWVLIELNQHALQPSRGAEESIGPCFEYKSMGESDLCHVWQKMKFTAAMLLNILMYFTSEECF